MAQSADHWSGQPMDGTSQIMVRRRPEATFHSAKAAISETTRKKGKGSKRTFLPPTECFTWETFRRLSVKPDMPSFTRETWRYDRELPAPENRCAPSCLGVAGVLEQARQPSKSPGCGGRSCMVRILIILARAPVDDARAQDTPRHASMCKVQENTKSMKLSGTGQFDQLGFRRLLANADLQGVEKTHVRPQSGKLGD